MGKIIFIAKNFDNFFEYEVVNYSFFIAFFENSDFFRAFFKPQKKY
jgi:hypothetical protein